MTIIQEQHSFYIAELKERFPNLTSTLSVEAKTTIVEALLFNYPLPQVVLLKTDYAKYEFLKGEQVIGALLDFYNGNFRLTNTSIYTKFEMFRFMQLDKMLIEKFKRRISTIVLLTENESTEQITKFKNNLKKLYDTSIL
jgi:hypothetical protein